MYLDMWYKLIAWHEVLFSQYRAGESLYNSSNPITVPEYKATTGSIKTKIAASINYGRAYRFSPYAPPADAIIAQGSTPNVYSDYLSGYPTNIIVGNGTTPPTASDYRVELEIVNGLSGVTVSSGSDVEKGTITYTKTMMNSSSEQITVSEIGLAAPTYDGSSSFYVLVYREVLDTPIVVAPGESFTVSITHKFPMPT